MEQSIASDLKKELASLPANYGFDTTDALLQAVRAASGKRRGRKPGNGKPASVMPKKKRRTRATVTDETRAAVKKSVEQGKTGGEIAKALGISLPSVQNIKKALGLVKKRQ